ncbi:DUF4129 domain-containing protein [Flaviaesturariibacter aridisoli]|uniref:DUF4129 domain-containing protein n=1 Tax=Flaviaesturariibacter aridisoli TaxID=2545761 RepID=A0A4R4E3B9_9BACT|nr:DUF4129 domain-containing protein [Flaviaesturariibacter aridisoli]TCZ73313.1 DUF4129 domain-containing protein [Flaviaesturariibacter aridisoli]
MRSRFPVLLLIVLTLSSAALHAQEGAIDSAVVDSGAPVVSYDSSSIDATEVEEPRYSLDQPPPISQPLASDSSPVAVRPLPVSRLNEARREDDFWYWRYRSRRRSGREEQEMDSSSTSSSGSGFSVPTGLFWVLIGIGIAALLFLLLQAMGINPFGKRTLAVGAEGEPESAEDFFSRDFESGVSRALAAGDHRLAIRLRYLQVLRELADRNIIQYRQGATNGHYVSQLWGGRYYTDFFRITRTFEYAWYGMLPVTQATFDRMQQDVDHLKTRFA